MADYLEEAVQSLNKRSWWLTAVFMTLVGAISLLCSSRAMAATAPIGMPQYVSQFDGTGSSQFDMSTGIAIAPSGNIYVVDANNNRVLVFNSANNYLFQFGSMSTNGCDAEDGWVESDPAPGADDGKLCQPDGIAIGPSGNVFVADKLNNRIEKYSSSGSYLAEWGTYGSDDGQLDEPRGIAVSSSGKVYVSDSANSRIEVFSVTGEYLFQFGSVSSNGCDAFLGGADSAPTPGIDDGKLCQPDGITIGPLGNVFVADAINNRIQKFSASGTYLSQFGSMSSSCGGFEPYSELVSPGDNGKFCNPRGVVVDSSGNIYVADEQNARVQIFDRNGNYLTQFGGYGTGNGQFVFYIQQGAADVIGLAINGAGDLYVTDPALSRVQEFNVPVHQASLSMTTQSGQIVPDAVSVSVPSSADITCSDSINPASLAESDGNYEYPLGLVKYCFSTPSASNQVALTFETDLSPINFVVRKYNPSTKVYSDVPGATITETTVDGKHALELSYTVEDNGPLDTDPTVGEIEDPVGLATIPASKGNNAAVKVPGVPDTGFSVSEGNFVDGVIAMMIAVGISLIALKLRRSTD